MRRAKEQRGSPNWTWSTLLDLRAPVRPKPKASGSEKVITSTDLFLHWAMWSTSSVKQVKERNSLSITVIQSWPGFFNLHWVVIHRQQLFVRWLKLFQIIKKRLIHYYLAKKLRMWKLLPMWTRSALRTHPTLPTLLSFKKPINWLLIYDISWSNMKARKLHKTIKFQPQIHRQINFFKTRLISCKIQLQSFNKIKRPKRLRFRT